MLLFLIAKSSFFQPGLRGIFGFLWVPLGVTSDLKEHAAIKKYRCLRGACQFISDCIVLEHINKCNRTNEKDTYIVGCRGASQLGVHF